MFGKILVGLHLALSLTFATWAVALYANRVNWTDQKGKKGEPDGLLAERKTELEQIAATGLRPANARWKANREWLLQEEAWRPWERVWYAEQIGILSTGKDGKGVEKPILQIDRDAATGNVVEVRKNPNGPEPLLKMGPVLDKDGKPMKDRDGKDLQLHALEWYDREYNTVFAAVTGHMRRLQQASKTDLFSTVTLAGDKDGKYEKDYGDEYEKKYGKKIDKKGLITRIQMEAEKQKRVEEEYNEVRPLWLNTAVGLKNLEDLRRRLEVRLQQLPATEEPKAP
jgi:hypothetical protein